VGRERPPLLPRCAAPGLTRGVAHARLGTANVAARIVAYTESNCARREMAKPVPLPPPGFDDLSVDEQIEYVQSLWNRIAASPEQVPIPEWHREILDERVKDYEANPNAGESWDVVRERLRDKLRKP